MSLIEWLLSAVAAIAAAGILIGGTRFMYYKARQSDQERRNRSHAMNMERQKRRAEAARVKPSAPIKPPQ